MEDRGVKRHITVSVILVSFISAVLLLIGGIIYSSIKGAQEKEAQKYMEEIVSQYKNIIAAQIDRGITLRNRCRQMSLNKRF